ncbi:MAG: ATP synthase F0 subunit B [Eubacterium sp.]|nr:ATP synthase F0 subunit B [Eubacterium sp.]
MPLGIDFLQIFLHLFNVVILFGGLYILLYSPVVDFMKKRDDHYAKMHEEAEEYLDSAQKMKGEYEEKLKSMEEEISRERAEAATKMEEYRASRMKEAEAEAKEVLVKAKEEGRRRRDLIVSDAKEDISKLIEEAAQKIMLGESTEHIYDAFLDEAERGEARDE